METYNDIDRMWHFLGDAPSTEEAAANAIAVYKAAKDKAHAAAKPYEAVMAAAKERLNDIIVETGRLNWKCDAGSAIVPAPGVTVSYNADALDALCASDADLARILTPHRIAKERPGSLTIR